MALNVRTSAIAEGASFVLLAAALVAIQVLIGGTRMVFSLPCYALLGGTGLLSLFSLRRVKPTPSQLCLAFAAIFFGYILARAWLSPTPFIARSDIHSVLGGLVVYFFTACIFTSARLRMLLLAILLVLAVGHTAVGTLQFRDASNFMPISWLQRSDYGFRASGFYICPNHLAGLLEVLAILGLSIVCWSRWPAWGKTLIGYAVAVSYAGIVLTGSRGGYLSTIASLAVFAFLSLAILRRAGRELFWKIGGAGIVAALVLGLSVAHFVSKSDQLSGRAQSVFETTNMRVDLWQSALQQWRLAPIFGTGSATFLYFGRLFRTDRVQLDPVHVHNDYLQLLAEYGLVGAAGMALFLAAHIWRGLRNFARLGPKRVATSQRILSNALALNLGALAAVCSYLVHSALDFNLHIPGNALLMAFVFGLLANGGVPRKSERTVASPRQSLWRWSLPLLATVILVQCVRLFPGEYYSERARAAVRDWRPAVAILSALTGLKYDPRNPDLYHHLGAGRIQLAELMRDPLAADSFRRAGIVAFEKARFFAPLEEIYAFELASALDGAGRFDEAESVYYDLFRLDPRSDSLRRSYDWHLELWSRSGGTGAKGL